MSEALTLGSGRLAKFAGRIANATKLLAKSLSMDDAQKLVAYLVQFGYLTPETVEKLDTLDAAIKVLQGFIGLFPTGQPDANFVTVLTHKPRCGHPDTALFEEAKSPVKWGMSSLSYVVAEYVEGLLPSTQDELLAKAFSSWSDICGLKFKQMKLTSSATNDNPQIVISRGSGSHQGFDGPFGVLAYAFLPTNANFMGQLVMRFDNSETWLDGSANQRGILYLNVAAHEIGHLLGLEHSSAKGALMAPYYNIQVASPQLVDDISRIQTLYGRPAPRPVPPFDPPIPPTPPSALPLLPEHLTDEGRRVLMSWFTLLLPPPSLGKVSDK